MRRRFVTTGSLALMLAGCQFPSSPPLAPIVVSRPVTPSQIDGDVPATPPTASAVSSAPMALAPLLPTLGERAIETWWQSLAAQCGNAAARKKMQAVQAAAAPATTGADACDVLSRATGTANWMDKGRALAQAFDLSCGAQGLMTAYYEPILSGSRQRQGPAQVALYAMPEAAKQAAQEHQPWLTRSELEADPGAAGLQPLLWLDDPVEAFFLQIQGSGRIRLRDSGEFVRAAYAGNNGQAYHAIGASLIERGEFKPEEISAQAIKQWLHQRLNGTEQQQAEAVALMNANPRYVFFAVKDLPAGSEASGPTGALGVPLQAQASVAADPAVYPPGSTLLLYTALTGPRLVQVQDVGSAIKGAARLDLFAGSGEAAGEWAGNVRQKMQVFTLTPAAAQAGTQLDMATALANCSAGK